MSVSSHLTNVDHASITAAKIIKTMDRTNNG